MLGIFGYWHDKQAFVEFAEAACADNSLQHALWLVNAVIKETPVVETMTVEEHYEVVQMILTVIEKIAEGEMKVNVESILKFKYIG